MTSTLPFTDFSFAILALVFLLNISFSKLEYSSFLSPFPFLHKAINRRKPQNTDTPTLDSFAGFIVKLPINPEEFTKFASEEFGAFPISISLANKLALCSTLFKSSS
ncbi:hypothetical protein Hanom_Chr04g00279771 [Helianthus anomalus]